MQNGLWVGNANDSPIAIPVFAPLSRQRSTAPPTSAATVGFGRERTANRVGEESECGLFLLLRRVTRSTRIVPIVGATHVVASQRD